MSDKRSPRVAARIAGTRVRILEAAREVLADNGFDAAQVAVVAAAADVATGTVYRHFPSKAALFAEMLRSVCETELAVVRAIADETDRSAAERIGDAVGAFATRALMGEGLSYAVIIEPMDREVDQVRLEARAALADVFTDLITAGIRAGEFAEQDARLRGAAIVGAMLESLVAPLAQRDDLDHSLATVPTELARFCRAAVGDTSPADSATPARVQPLATGTAHRGSTK
ncbi:MAG TPA: TetR/AcrR family transcriptional regulator [Aldersonia sp.]